MRIALDIDDVLAAFTPHAHAFHGVPMEKCNYWCVETMDARLGKKWFSGHIATVREFWRTLPVLSPASDIDFEVDCYISSFPSEMYEERIQWLREHGYPDRPLIVSNDKLATCLEMGIDVLVDDKPETITRLQGTPIRGIHFINHYAAFEPVGTAVRSLKEVKQVLKGRKKLCLLGNARHGKDTVAEMLQKLFDYQFESSSIAAARIFLFDALKDKYGYTTIEECFEDRVNHRAEWYDLICDFNKIEKSALATEIMRDSDIYVGMRDNAEIEACIKKGVFDLVIGVYDPRKPLEDKSSFNINMWEKSDIIIPNAGTLEDLERRVGQLRPLLT